MARDPRFSAVYQAFAQFLQNCLVDDRSLLWPDREVWTVAALEEMRRRFVEGFVQGRGSFRQKLGAQLSGAPPEVWAMAADLFFVYGLPSTSIRFQTKKDWVTWAAQQSGYPIPADDDPIWRALQTGFAPTGQKYNLKHAQLRLLTLLALEVKASPGRPALIGEARNLQSLIDSILEAIPVRIDRANDMRNAVLYMAFPDLYEPILANRDKDAIVQHYLGKGAAQGDREAALRKVREAVARRVTIPDRPFDFYTDLREEWRQPPADLEKLIVAQIRQPHAVSETPQAQWWQHASSEADPDLRRALSALRLTRNLILSGPPGVGKTYLAQRLSERLSEPGGYQVDGSTWWVTLHPSYAYEDFIEGLRPVLADPLQPAGEVAYEVRPGIFRQACERAAQNPSRPFVLVLDEINRGNLASVFGELITLIEDDKRGVLSARLPYSGISFTVPPNLILIGTMNTADRSIALMDTALRRRFAFVDILPRPELLAGAVVETDEVIFRLDHFLICLNTAIRDRLGPEQQIGHSYLLRVLAADTDDRLSVLELVWNHQILPLLLEYFYHRPEQLAEILGPFLDDAQGVSIGSEWIAPARLAGEDLVVALSRMCDGETRDG